MTVMMTPSITKLISPSWNKFLAPTTTKSKIILQQKCCFETLAVIDPRKISKQGINNTNKGDESKRKQKQSKHRKQRGQSSYKFVDVARLKIVGGNGGKGCLSHVSKLGSKFKKRPDGGHGGNGGLVVIVADANEQSLNMSTHHYKGEDGAHGSSKEKHGRNGKDKIIRVPCGVVVKRVLGYDEEWDEEERTVRKIILNNDDHNFEEKMAIYGNPHTAHDDIDSFESNDSDDMNRIHHGKKGHNSKESDRPSDYEEIVNQGIKSEDDGMYYFDNERGNEAFLGMGYGINDDELVSSSSESFSDREKVVVADLDKPGSYVVAAYGGRGGVGNCVYAKRQFNQDIVAKAGEKSRSKPGEEVHLELELKLIADIGLVGFPNAGKSSLLAAMSKARPEIAPYPFTTLHPLIGCVEYRDGFRAIVADVPGLVDGAALGRGRGHDFLKHLERTKALLYIVDAAGVDGRDPLEDFSILVDEIQSYGDGDMMARPALVVANKLDLIKDEMMREEIYLALDDMAKEKGIISHEGVLGISAGVTGEGLPHLSKSIRELVELGEQFRSDQNELYVVES